MWGRLGGGVKPVAALRQGAPCQMTWLEDPPPWLRPAYLLCFGNMVNRKFKKCYHIWTLYLFYFDSKIIIGIGGLCFDGDCKRTSTFLRKKVHPVTSLEEFLISPRNDLAPLLRWRLHLMTCLTTLVTWKWSGYALSWRRHWVKPLLNVKALIFPVKVNKNVLLPVL